MLFDENPLDSIQSTDSKIKTTSLMNANGLSDSVRQDLVKRFLLINLDYPVKASANFPNFWVQILHKEATFCSPNSVWQTVTNFKFVI